MSLYCCPQEQNKNKNIKQLNKNKCYCDGSYNAIRYKNKAEKALEQLSQLQVQLYPSSIA